MEFPVHRDQLSFLPYRHLLYSSFLRTGCVRSHLYERGVAAMGRSLDVPGPFRVPLSIFLFYSLRTYFGTGSILGRRLWVKAIGAQHFELEGRFCTDSSMSRHRRQEILRIPLFHIYPFNPKINFPFMKHDSNRPMIRAEPNAHMQA